MQSRIAFFAISSIFCASAIKLPDFVTPCKRNDPQIEKCFTKNYHEVIRRMANGIPEMNLRKTNPMRIDKLFIDFGGAGSQSINLAVNLKDLDIFGLPETKLTKTHIDFDKLTFDLGSYTKSMKFVGEYNALGRILLIPINSTGIFKGQYDGVSVDGRWEGTLYNKKGAQYSRWNNTYLNININNISTYMDNLFPTNEELTINTNKVINENADVLYTDVKPIVEETIKTIVFDSMKGVFDKFPFDVLYPN